MRCNNVTISRYRKQPLVDTPAQNVSILISLQMEDRNVSCTPDREDCVKRLFNDSGEGCEVGGGRWSSSSEYFSQSSEESGRGNSHLFDSPQVG